MIRARICSCLLLFSLLLTLAAPAWAAEDRDLSGGTLTLALSRYTYNGTAHTPGATVTLNGTTLSPGTDYTLSYQNNIDAGTATVTATGQGDYTGSCSAVFAIQPRPLSAEDISIQSGCIKAYDGKTTASPTLTAQVLPGDDVSVTYSRASFDSRFAGRNKTVTVSGIRLSGTDSGNYSLPDGITLTDDSGWITPQQPQFPTTVSVPQGGQKFDFMDQFEGTAVKSVVVAANSDLLGCTLSGSVLTTGDQTGTISLLLYVDENDINGDGQPECDSGQATVTVTITQRQSQEDLSITGPAADPDGSEAGAGARSQQDLSLAGATTVTYGQTLQLSVQGGNGTGAVRYYAESYGSDGGEATINSSGLLTAKKAGKVLVTATKAGDETYAPATAEGVLVTIRPATITIQVGNKTAQVGDAIPALSSQDYTVSGLVGSDTLQAKPTLTYATAPLMSRAETVAIQASGAVVPAGGNYDPNIVYRAGQLMVQEKPIYGITLTQYANGTLSASTQAATQGTTVTITATPAQGYHLDSLTVTGEDGSKPKVTLSGSTGTFAMPDASVKVTASFVSDVSEVTLAFTDVSQGDWYYESVAYVYEKGLMTGTSDTAFSPQGTVTRGMLVTILYRLAGSPEAPAWAPFSDVSSGKYYTAAVAWGAWNGIVNGTTSTTFQPDSPVTREQLATIFYRYASYQGYSLTAQGDLRQFRDLAQLHSYAKEAVTWANGAGLISGKSNNRLDPQGTATRAETAAILQRFCTAFGL